jgi:hypothetical protein
MQEESASWPREEFKCKRSQLVCTGRHSSTGRSGLVGQGRNSITRYFTRRQLCLHSPLCVLQSNNGGSFVRCDNVHTRTVASLNVKHWVWFVYSFRSSFDTLVTLFGPLKRCGLMGCSLQADVIWTWRLSHSKHNINHFKFPWTGAEFDYANIFIKVHFPHLAQAVSRRLPIATAQVRARVMSCWSAVDKTALW